MTYIHLIALALEGLKAATISGKPRQYASRYSLRKFLHLPSANWIFMNKALRKGVTMKIFKKKKDSFRLDTKAYKQMRNKKKIKKSNTVLVGFTLTTYKKCLLVKHPMNLQNSQQIGSSFALNSFTRPMYWNQTLSGWVASPKDHDELIRIGIQVR